MDRTGTLNRRRAAAAAVVAAAVSGALSASPAGAITYTYTVPTPEAAGTDNWSAGTGGGWDQTPAPATDATLVFNGPTTAASRTSNNDVANPFQLNVLTLAGANSTASATVGLTVQGSALSLVSTGGGATPVVNLDAIKGGTITAYNFVVNTPIALGANTSFTGNGSASTFSFGGAITGAGGITKSGSSLLRFNSTANAYGGATTVTAGTLFLGANGVVPDASAVTVSGGLLDWNNRSETIGSLTVSGSGVVNNTNATSVIAGALNHSGTSTGGSGAALVVNGGGKMTINGAASFAAGSQTLMSGSAGTRLTFNGGLTITGATIRMNTGADSRVVLGSNVTVNDPGTTASSAIGNSAAFPNGLDLNGAARTFTVANGSAAVDFTINAAVLSSIGTGSLIKAGPGAMALANTGAGNTYTGGTTVDAGTLAAQANAALGTGDATVTTSAILDLSSTLVTTGAIADTATLTLAGTGGTAGKVAFGTSTLSETVGGLVLGGVAQPFGVYTAANRPDYITGSGSINVVPEPATIGLVGVAAVGLLGRRRRPGRRRRVVT